MSDLLPPGIPLLTYEDLKDELVGYLHGEKTAYARDVIKYYIENNKRLNKAYSELKGLTQLLRHTPEIEPSKNFHRRIAKALPELRHTHKVSYNLQTIIQETGWGIEERVLFLWAFIKFRIKQQPSAILSLCGMILFLVTAITILPKIISSGVLPASNVAFTEIVIPDVMKTSNSTKNDLPKAEVIPDFANIIESSSVDYKSEHSFKPFEFNKNDYPIKSKDDSVVKNFAPTKSIENTSILIKPELQVLNWYSKRQTKEKELSEREREAIDDALTWLTSMQYQDGSFRKTAPDKTSKHSEVTENSNNTRTEADNTVIILTAYAALSYITDGYSSYAQTPAKKPGMSNEEYAKYRQKFSEYRLVVRKAINFLKSAQDDYGFIGNWTENGMLAHSLALLALVEDRVTSNNWRLIAAIRKGVRFLVEYQNIDGGWGHSPADNLSFLKPTVWSVIALKTASQSDADFLNEKSKVFEKANDYLKTLSDPDGYYSESDRKAYPEGYLRPTSEGLLLQTILKSVNPETLGKTIALMTEERAMPQWGYSNRVAKGTYIDYDYWFFGYLAFNSIKEDLSKPQEKLVQSWKDNLLKTILDNQYEYGGWEEVNPHSDWGKVFSTASAVLTLQNKYRYSFD